MAIASDLLKEGRTEELWQRCCGFIDLTMEQFMTIQRQLLEEQIELLKQCELGRIVMRGAAPRTIDEFREQVPLTTYADYAPYLLEKREDVLPEKPILWQRTSGRSGEFAAKWVPVTRRQYEDLEDAFMAVLIFGSCRERGEVVLEEHDKLLYGLAPPPYVSGSYLRAVDDMGVFDILPPIDEAEQMEFDERTEVAFRMAMSQGLDLLPAIPSILVAIGERFGQGGGLKRVMPLLRQPRMLAKMLRAVLKAKLARRQLLPRDVWKVKGVIAGGSDNAIYRQRIKELWGQYPLDSYGSTECVLTGVQTWDHQGMTFLPQFNFLEFMPEKEWDHYLEDRGYRPPLLTLDEVLPGQNYAMVCTNLRGGPFVRYFLGDAIRIESLRNETLNINLPQMSFLARMDGIIDIAGFARLTEKTIWQALESSGLPYQDWSVRKEAGETPILHFYIEPKAGTAINEEQAVATIHDELRRLDSNYADLDTMLGLNPVTVTVLPTGSFAAYINGQRAAGADLAHLKPAHVNPPEAIIDTLLTPVS